MENGERRTENGERSARQARDGWSAGRMWKVCPAGLTQRTRRTTKVHEEGLPEWETADYGRTQRLTEGNRGTQRRAACCRRQDCQCVLGITNFGNHKGHEGHKASGAGAGRACAKAHVRPGGLEGHGGLRTPCFGFGSRRLHDLDQEMQEIQEIQERPCGATAKPLCKAATAAVL